MHLGFPVVPLEYNIANSVSKSNLLKLIFSALVWINLFHLKKLIFLNLNLFLIHFLPG